MLQGGENVFYCVAVSEDGIVSPLSVFGYTVGGVIYALKVPVLDKLHKYFGLHEIFHLFIMGGSFCHFMFMFLYVA